MEALTRFTVGHTRHKPMRKLIDVDTWLLGSLTGSLVDSHGLLMKAIISATKAHTPQKMPWRHSMVRDLQHMAPVTTP